MDMNIGADTPADTKDPVLEAKKREADLAETEARLQKSLKEIAQSKKDASLASNAELVNAEQEKTKALAEQAIAEAEKLKFNASLPTSTSKPLEGKVDLDDRAGYFVEILAYETVQDNAAKIAKAVSGKLDKAKTVYLVKQPDYLKGALQLQEVENRLTIFNNNFNALLGRYAVEPGNVIAVKEAAPLLALAAAPAVLGALADVAAMFRVDRTIKGRQTSVSDEALAVDVVRVLQELKGKDIRVVRPSLIITIPDLKILTMLQETRKKFGTASLRLTGLREALAINSNRIDSISGKITGFQAQLDKVTADKTAERKDVEAKIKNLEEQIGSLKNSLDGLKNQTAIGEVAVAQFDAVLKAFSDFDSKLVSVPDGGTTSPLANLAETCILRDCDPDDLILTVAVPGQGGEVETRKSIWTSGRVYHRAGSACSYILFAKDGRIIESGLVVVNRQMKEGKQINVTNQ
jgi:DNA-binding transcriptional MerR regulator